MGAENQKQEIIKEHWLRLMSQDQFNTLKIDENGYSDWRCRKFIPSSQWDLLSDIFKKGSSRKIGSDILYRPKSLKGIDDNNGWTKIDSELDLPERDKAYKVIAFDGRVYGAYLTSQGNWLNNKHSLISRLTNVTHFKPEAEEKLPFY